jgi:thiosulfate/3-mercaptopyruvate sulfurtransferase
MTYTTIVSTELVQAHLSTWAIVDCRFDLQNDAWGREQYLAAHIPGAVYASLNEDLAGERTGQNGRHPLPSIDALARTFARFGIDRSTQVVVYDQDAGLYASRVWWSLRYLGHDAVALLDGGWTRWMREGRPARSGNEVRQPAAFVAAPRAGMQLPIDEVIARLDDPDTLLIDARGAERFEGRTEPLDRVAGHIPGAANRFYRGNLAEDGTMLPAAVLREQFEALLDGRTPDQAVAYCGSGVSACHNLLAMEHAGLTGTRLYVGSWSEWSSDPTRPVETGPSRTPRRS